MDRVATRGEVVGELRGTRRGPSPRSGSGTVRSPAPGGASRSARSRDARRAAGPRASAREHGVDPAQHVDGLRREVEPARAAPAVAGPQSEQRRRTTVSGVGAHVRHHDVHLVAADPAGPVRGERGQVGGRRQLATVRSSARRSRPSAPGRRAARAPTRPGPSAGRRARRGSRPAGRGRPRRPAPSAGAHGRGGERGAGQLEGRAAGPAAPPAARARSASVGRRVREQQLGERTDADPEQLVDGYVDRVDRRARRSAAGSPGQAQRLLARPRPGPERVSTRSASPADAGRRGRSASRRTSSSCAAPGGASRPGGSPGRAGRDPGRPGRRAAGAQVLGPGPGRLA